MNGPYALTPLSAVARPVERLQRPIIGTIYRQLGVHLWGGGAYEREPLEGSQTRYASLNRVEPGDIVVNKIWARNGSVAVVPSTLGGALVSGEFPTFTADPVKLDPRWVNWLTKTPGFWRQCDEKSRGTSGKNRIRPERFLEVQIPLPPLDEQRRIVARVEALAARIEDAQGLRRQAVEEAAVLRDAAFRHILTQGLRETNWQRAPLRQCAIVNPSRRGTVKFEPEKLVSFVPMAAVDEVSGRIVAAEDRPFHAVANGHTWFETGDVIFARITPCMQNGKSAVAEALTNGVGFGSTEFHVLRPGPRLTAEWLHSLVRHKDFRDEAARHFKGTAGQQRVPQSFLEQVVVPIPPVAEQRRIVVYLDGLQAKVDALRQLQGETAAELDALLPSILERAFSGEL